MTEEPQQTVILPMGRGSGRSVSMAEALQHLAVDMLGEVRELERETPPGALPVAELERYAITLLILSNQLDPSNNLDELAKAAAKLGLDSSPGLAIKKNKATQAYQLGGFV